MDQLRRHQTPLLYIMSNVYFLFSLLLGIFCSYGSLVTRPNFSTKRRKFKKKRIRTTQNSYERVTNVLAPADPTHAKLVLFYSHRKKVKEHFKPLS